MSVDKVADSKRLLMTAFALIPSRLLRAGLRWSACPYGHGAQLAGAGHSDETDFTH